jgi:pimeloyl-ACP methyl ester carboxylesterase
MATLAGVWLGMLRAKAPADRRVALKHFVMIALGVLAALLIGVGLWAYTPDESRTELEAKYGASPADYIEVAGIRLHVRDTGSRDAPAVVLLHGFGSNLQTWDGWVDGLAASYRVIRYDLPGFALTGPDPTGDYSDLRGLQVLNALLDRLGVARAILIGNSIGGRLAWKFAAQNPTRVESLVLVSPDGFASPGLAYGRKPSVPTYFRFFLYALPKAMVRMSLAPAYGDPRKLTDQTVTRYWDLMRAPGVRAAMIARLKQTILEPPEPLLRQIQAPTLLIWGEKDAMIPIANAADYLRTLPDSILVPLVDLGHVPQEEAPALSLVPVVDFVGAASSRRSR